jgi:SNF2 family DNA or RNA helicase
MGLGKTRITIDTLGLLWLNDYITHALILAPAGVYRNWEKEFVKHLPDTVRVEMHTWNKMTTKTEKASFAKLISPETGGDNGCLKVMLMNVEALSTGKGYDFAKKFLQSHGPGAMVVDESSTIKNRRARRTKNTVNLGRFAAYRRILSGLPTPNSPLDLWAPFEFLSGAQPNLLGYKNYYAFTGRYAIQRTMRLGSQRQFQTIVGYRNLEDLQSRVDNHAARLTKEECLDLPEKIYLTRESVLSPEQRRLYTQLKDEALAELGTLTVAPKNVISRLLRLQQVVCGHVGTDGGETVTVPGNRLKVLMELLEEIPGKVVIWANFRHSVKMIHDEIAKTYGKDSVAMFYGDTTTAKRVETNTSFQDPKSELRFLVANPSVAGYGLDLTEASVCVYFSRDFRLDTRLQSEDRLHRIGQTKAVTYIDIVTPNTIDDHVRKALRQKMVLSAKVLGEKAQAWVG